MHPATCQRLGKLGPSPMQPGFHGPDRSVQREGNLLVRQTLLVKQDKGGTVLRPKPFERPPQFSGQIIRIGQPWPVVDLLFGGLTRDRSLRPFCQGGPTAVGGDSQEPGSKWTIAIEAIETPQGADERLLHDILGVVPVTHHA